MRTNEEIQHVLDILESYKDGPDASPDYSAQFNAGYDAALQDAIRVVETLLTPEK